MAFHGELGGDTTVARKNPNSLYPAPLLCEHGSKVAMKILIGFSFF